MFKAFRVFYLSLISLLGLCGAVAIGNYTMTQGAGTTFGSVVVGGFHYAQQFVCDLTTPAQCAAVSAGGAVKVDGSAAAQPVISGTAPVVTMNSASANAGVTSALASVFDDASPTACTENNFCYSRMSANRNQYTTIRDGAGNERGANVNASNQLTVAVDGGSVFNANGQTTMANSSPVTIASNQSANPLWGHVATGAAPPANVTYTGANASGATGGLIAGLVQCDNKAVYDASTNGSTELVALTSGRSVYVCGYSIMAGGTVNVKLIYGTGTACATGSNNLTPAWQLTAQAGISDPSPFYRGMKTASANALCINTSAGVAAQAIVYYSII